jgi:hypothetical protein
MGRGRFAGLARYRHVLYFSQTRMSMDWRYVAPESRGVRCRSPRKGETMDQIDPLSLPEVVVLAGEVRAEASRNFVRFCGGRFEGRHRWPDYSAFIEPNLKRWEREAIYRLWVRALGASHAVPFSACPEPATRADTLAGSASRWGG